jgi:glycosyltransferase involved in cell wall biosynthesis
MQIIERIMISILLCTYNGEKYLNEQLESFVAQAGVEWQLFVSDDGSKDTTWEILKQFQRRFPQRVMLFQGPRQGFVANYFSLLARPEITADYYALADQDDVWLPEKLSKAVAHLSGELVLYCSRTQAVDDALKPLTLSPLFKRRISFQNALVQSLAGANTMVFNQAALDLCRKAGLSHKVVSHDWWLYMLITGAGGRMIYDAESTLLYRQHAGNVIGANQSFRAKIYRFKFLIAGRFKSWNDMNLAGLKAVAHLFTPENQASLTHYNLARVGSLLSRMRHYWKSGVYRQTLAGTLSLIAAVLLNKL